MDPRISILTFPQRFDGNQLELNILLVPRLSPAWNGDPLQPLITAFPNVGDTTPAFADANLQLEARVIDGLDRFPANTPVHHTAALPAASGALPNARQLLTELVAPVADRFKLTANQPRLAEKVKPEIYVSKLLPPSYLNSTLFTGPRARHAVTDDSYRCAIEATKDINPAFQTTPDEVSWGQIYAFCLRNPQLARRVGLIRSASFNIPAGLLEEGGFLYVGLAAGSDYQAQAAADFSFLKRYAARIPALEAGTPRDLFAAVQFPVLFDDPGIPGPPSAPGNFDSVFIEAADYDDGFAKIVHGVQPVSQNLLATERDEFTPLTDIGIRLGWDDEQILIWQNRQLEEDPTVPLVPGEPQRLDAPMGVFGYRIDARRDGEAAWHSLVRVRSRAPLAIGGVPLGEPGQLFEGELGVEVHPMQLDGNQATGRFWLPAYLSQWDGTSLVLPDEIAAALYKTEQDTRQQANLGRMYDAVGMDEIPLRYGESYDFRVRLMDPTGGGPSLDSEPVHESPAPNAEVHFVRRVVPEPVRLAGIGDDPTDDLFPDDELVVNRPLLGYPSVVFTGKYADPVPLLQAASDAAEGNGAFGIPDPDVQRVRIDVEVRALRMDNLMSISGRESYIHFYSTERAFPADLTAARTIPFEFRDANVLEFGNPLDLGDLGSTQAEIDAMDALPLPTAREIRLTIRAVADEDPVYFGPGAHIGKSVRLMVRRESTAETGLVAALSEARSIRGIYLQPEPEPVFDGTIRQLLFERTTGSSPSSVERLSQQLGVEHKGMTLVGKKGERVVFACSRGIRHTLSPDHSSLTFAAKEDLLNQWIVALTVQLDRDWTWDGLDPVSFEIFRTKHFQSDDPGEADTNNNRPIGDWEIIPTASIQSLSSPQRGHTTLIFLDAVEPKSQLMQAANPAETRFPDIIELDYRIEPRFRHNPNPADEFVEHHLDLPVTTTPTQVPQIVSAGIALSKYERDETYSATGARQRFLWLEFAEPVRDPNDAYFIRPLGYAPDPLLSDNRLETFVPPEEDPLPIDPELMRVITPNQADDQAGLSAMVQMEKAGNSDRHYLVPLPAGMHLASPELFGFFTNEVRVGHANIWSTAQGRFGRALRTTGMQHPAPTLFCTSVRNEDKLIVEAPFAEAVLNGKNITANPPRTEIWALLYAQVRQADGKDYRNILLDDRKLRMRPRRREGKPGGGGALLAAFENVDAPARGITAWSQSEVSAALRALGLPQDSDLSVLCVEMMPTLQTLVTKPNSVSGGGVAGGATNGNNLAAAVREERAGASSLSAATVDAGNRPLSDALGHYRILRTSPLTPVPEVCCEAC